MPVTNEQLTEIKSSFISTAVVYNDFSEKDYVNLVTVGHLCTDLLDARATIEKQSALIKEMREYIETCIVYEGVGKFRFNPDVNKQAELLERTKDFA